MNAIAEKVILWGPASQHVLADGTCICRMGRDYWEEWSHKYLNVDQATRGEGWLENPWKELRNSQYHIFSPPPKKFRLSIAKEGSQVLKFQLSHLKIIMIVESCERL